MKINLGTLEITSPAFAHGADIPAPYTGGNGISPPLAWSGVPEGTRSFALISHDPDAPVTNGFVQWVIYGIPGDVTEIPEGAQSGFTLGASGLGDATWVPPQPPPGHGEHFYYFHLYALDVDPDLPGGLNATELIARIDEHILAQARVVGKVLG